MRKILTGLTLSILLILGACSSGTGDEKGNSSEPGNSEEKTTITFWHAMSGDNGKAIEEIAEKFNEQSDSVTVEAIFQGSYEDLLNKLRAVGGSSEAPALVQVFEGGTKYMSGSGFITPMQEFIDKEQFDVSTLEPNILSYYRVDDQLYSMPFNTSNAVMFYNKDMFKKVGLDPENPPHTFSEVQEAAAKLTDGKKQYGFSFATISWFFEELMANNGGVIINQDNGRTGEATESLINSEEGLSIFNWINEMNQAGTFKNFGSSWEDPRAPFFAGQLGMYFDSTANTAEVIKNSPFEVGTAPIPVADGKEPQGAVVGGASVWITNQVSEENQNAAWEFVKYMTNADVQAEWAAATGYFPITPAAYDEKALKDVHEEYPQYLTAVKQLENTKANPATAGALFTIMPEARMIIETALGEMYEGKDPKAALDDAAKKITEALE
ncbi:sn-glycerol 3-phosphate transport system substrate-binding protein [Lederbergia galactosidilyticus]|uniref:ABC transporter substrate-binding protein n=1 Tax=Lederbergia galactosidilytica TaxID=217031 RepID=UPI001AE95F50|nr:ABC transporter substrate-binding protein [Lederbergia galactosidilytica]MBP1915799.1 sn-glycerol 3-phosphate transport system substrate-binding protein [Lederbergia galactosidilytica]